MKLFSVALLVNNLLTLEKYPRGECLFDRIRFTKFPGVLKDEDPNDQSENNYSFDAKIQLPSMISVLEKLSA